MEVGDTYSGNADDRSDKDADAGDGHGGVVKGVANVSEGEVRNVSQREVVDVLIVTEPLLEAD